MTGSFSNSSKAIGYNCATESLKSSGDAASGASGGRKGVVSEASVAPSAPSSEGTSPSFSAADTTLCLICHALRAPRRSVAVPEGRRGGLAEPSPEALGDGLPRDAEFLGEFLHRDLPGDLEVPPVECQFERLALDVRQPRPVSAIRFGAV